jgi:ubiquitin-protein ligase
MQWYVYDKRRLKVEVALMERNGVNFELCMDEDGNLLWRGSICVLGHFHGDVRLVYPENFPYEPMKVYIFKPRLPRIASHVFVDGSICYLELGQWSPEWTAFAVYLTTIRFLHDFYSGKMGVRS